MKSANILSATEKYGGPFKLLILQFLGGQLIGSLLALSCYAWLISILHIHHQSSSSSSSAIVGIASYITIYILACLPATWLFFTRPWFAWVSITGDVIATAGSIAVAVLTRGSTANCAGLLTTQDAMAIAAGNSAEACKLQKVVFATGVCNA